MRKSAVVAAMLSSLCLVSCLRETPAPVSSNSSALASPTLSVALTDAANPPFTVCQGTFALCTTAKCKHPEGPNPPPLTLDCLCEVAQGYSAGKKACSAITQDPPTKGLAILSRYSPINSTAVCAARVAYAQCLDSPCTVDEDPSKAKCSCARVDSPGGYVVGLGTHSDAMCRSHIWSSASLDDLFQITGFLYAQHPQLLKPLPINIVRVDLSR
ncbi:MAG: hypothetical protein H7Z16_16655 [Pyrinomonadaceae bacterium]|nr:hypothetical protein [Pyrinomonadaceae bacterium]